MTAKRSESRRIAQLRRRLTKCRFMLDLYRVLTDAESGRVGRRIAKVKGLPRTTKRLAAEETGAD